MISHMVRRLRGSRPVVGSSRKMISGSPMRVMARSSRRRMPPEYVARGCLAASTRSNFSRSPAVRRLSSAGGRCRSLPMRARFSSPVSRLSTAENCPVRPILPRTSSAWRTTSKPSHGDLPAIGADQRGQDMDDGGLAGAVGTQEGEDGSGRDGEVNAVEDLLAAVCLAQPGHGDGRRSSTCHDLSCLWWVLAPGGALNGWSPRRCGRGSAAR